MIDNYEIKKVNNEEILYIYLNFNIEFGKIDFKKEKNKFQNIIKEFIRENEIAFKGTTVALVIGGAIVGNIILNNDKKNTPLETTYQEEVYTPKIEDDIKIETEENNTQQIVYDSIEEEKINDDIPSIKLEEKKEESVNEQIEEVKEEIKDEIKEDIPNEIVEDNKTYVNIRRSNGETIQLELEEYIIGVVGAEMPAAFNEQALMAQAVIARTYALKAISRGVTLTDNESTQSYKSNMELQNLWGGNYNTYYQKIKNAVLSTEGEYLTYNGTYIEAVYHSTSNGYTEDASNVWGNYFPYLVSVQSEYDNLNPSFEQTKNISYEELSLKLNMEINQDVEFNIINRTISNRVNQIEVNGKIYKGVEFRNILGLRSADFDIEKNDTGIKFKTRGYGHGVGLSQYGANGMAKAGFSYIDILKHYYRGVFINSL